VGVYGAVAYSVAQRTREIALRMALGATPAVVGAFLVRRALTPVGAGALVGSLGSAALARTSWRVMFAGAAGFGVCELALAPLRNVALVGTLLVVCGVFFTTYTANSNATIQLQSPDHIRGRVLGLYYYAWNGLAPAGSLLVGWLCAAGGTTLAFSVAGGCALAMTALGAWALKRPLREQPQVRAEPAERLAA